MDSRNKRIAKENLDHAAWECFQSGVDKDVALRIVAAQYEDMEATNENQG